MQSGEQNGLNPNFIDTLIALEGYLVQPLLDAQSFIAFCRSREVEVTLELLEKLEEIDQFLPLVRVAPPEITLKIEWVEGGGAYRIHGELQDGEAWSGDTRVERANVIWHQPILAEWYAQGLIWEPGTRPFRPWKSYIEAGRQAVWSFYSVHQIGSLKRLIDTSTVKVSAFCWSLDDADRRNNLLASIDDWVRMSLTSKGISNRVAIMCQLLANQYLPFARSDRRTIPIPGVISSHGRGWEALRNATSPQDLKTFFPITEESLRNLYITTAGEAQGIDPLARWHELVSFISVQKRDDLKGKALLAQTLYEAAQILSAFYEDIYGKRLHKPHEGWDWREETLYGQGVTDNTLEHLTYLTNRYHLNPKPKLILMLEGAGEFANVPHLAEYFLGYSLSQAGIETQTLLGIGNFEGNKKIDRFSALEKFIDDHHARQTPVFLVLDNEGKAEKVVQKLLKAESKRNSGRKVTRSELIHLWECSIEFDNFDNSEIAQALSAVSDGRYTFTSEQVADCRAMFKRRGDPLSDLYREKLNYDLNKVKLLQILFNQTMLEASEVDSLNNRPLIKLIRKIVKIANLNHQPTNREISEGNQQTGLFG